MLKAHNTPCKDVYALNNTIKHTLQYPTDGDGGVRVMIRTGHQSEPWGSSRANNIFLNVTFTSMFIHSTIQYVYPVDIRQRCHSAWHMLTCEHIFVMFWISTYMYVKVCKRVRISDNSEYNISFQRHSIRSTYLLWVWKVDLIQRKWLFKVQYPPNVKWSVQRIFVSTQVNMWKYFCEALDFNPDAYHYYYDVKVCKPWQPLNA